MDMLACSIKLINSFCQLLHSQIMTEVRREWIRNGCNLHIFTDKAPDRVSGTITRYSYQISSFDPPQKLWAIVSYDHNQFEFHSEFTLYFCFLSCDFIRKAKMST